MAATLKTLVSLSSDVDAVAFPNGSLIADANGDLFGTTLLTVFEIAKTAAGYASTPTTLALFDDVDFPAGTFIQDSLLADANGDLFGTTDFGGANNAGTAFEIAKTPTGYASAPTILVTFDGADGVSRLGTLIADTNGDLFGTTTGSGANNGGTVFEIAKTAGGYASTATTLVRFNDANGRNPAPGLIADASGDLFGTTAAGGSVGFGTVFEIKKTVAGYASTPATLVNFINSVDSAEPLGSLIADSHGDLFGTTSEGGADGFGTVFEIKKTAAGYASTPTTLVVFNGGADGANPQGSLIADANGDLFGTTHGGVVGGDDGTVFEIKKTAAGYASAPTTLVIFNGDNGDLTGGSLIADASGDLFGTTESGGPGGAGTVFEVTDSGFVPVTPPPPPLTGSNNLLWQNTNGQASLWELTGNTHTGGGPVANPGPSWRIVETGDFTGDGKSDDILWQNANGQVSIWEMDGNTRTGGGAVANLGTSWKVVGTGDFDGDGKSDILWQNTSTGQVSVWEMDGNIHNGGGPVANLGPSWKVAGTGDFNGDGKSDILWQNTDGQVSIWEMDGNTRIGGGSVANLGPDWHAVGTGDFDGDGKSDILWQNTSTGQVSIWEMNGNIHNGGGPVSNLAPSWHAVGTNGGGSDILWQNTSGQTSIWQMNGNTIAGAGAISPNLGPSWHAVGLT